MLDLYRNIKIKRHELGMTQTELAQKMGYADKSMIARIEKGIVDLPISKALAFAKALDINLEELIGQEYDDTVCTKGNENMEDEMEKEFKIIFSRRLNYYLSKTGMTQKELAARLHVGTTSVYNWLHAVKTPRMDKVDAICEIFGCKRSDLIEEKNQAPLMLTNLEKQLIFAYRQANPDRQDSVRILLGIAETGQE